jgi:hypothetical protein
MSVYTVHEPPIRATGAVPESDRFIFVRDGFSFWAFIAAPLWMLWHRMWLVLLGYIVLAAILIAALVVLGASSGALAVVGLFIALLIGLEASTLRRFTLWRRGWRNVGVVNGHDVEDAERRFFDAWLGRAPAQRDSAAKPPPLPPSVPSAPRPPQQPDVLGLFPEPGAQR